jgi:hypothetical protein
MCNIYKAQPEAVRMSYPQGALIMTNFGSIDSKFKTYHSTVEEMASKTLN